MRKLARPQDLRDPRRQEHDLIDEFRLWTFPVVVGPGKRLVGDGTRPAGLKLVDVKTSTTGVVIGTYRRAGEIQTGSFALDRRPRPRSGGARR